MAESDKNLEHQQPQIESDPILEHQKESLVDERQVDDELEKDLQLSVQTEEFDEMSQLNPEAKVFVPVSPTRNGPLSPTFDGMISAFKPLSDFDDALVSQSPRKGESPLMEDITVPTEKDFDIEAESRPHEINLFVENGGFQRIESPEALNLKESMQEDDKLEQSYKDEAQPFFEEEKQQTGEIYKVLESSFEDYSNGFQNVIDDPMNRSFYEGRDNGDILIDAPRNPHVPDVLNTIQQIPTFEDEQPEADHHSFGVEKDAPEADWNINNEFEDPIVEDSKASGLLDTEASQTMDASSENFEAERFVEEIKNANSDFDKYVDQGLSPTLPEFSPNTIQTVEETAVVDKPLEEVLDTFVSEASNIGAPQIEVSLPEFKAVDEVNEPPPTPAAGIEEQLVLSPEPELITEKLEQVTSEEPKVESLSEIASGAAVVAAAAAVGTAVAAKKKSASAGSKTDVKAKAPVAPKTNPAPIKRPTTATSSLTKAAPAAKPSSASSTVAAKKLPSTTAKPASKPTVSSAPLSRPKPTTSTVPPVKKPSTGAISKTTVSAVKPTPITRTTTLTKKPSVTSQVTAK